MGIGYLQCHGRFPSLWQVTAILLLADPSMESIVTVYAPKHIGQSADCSIFICHKLAVYINSPMQDLCNCIQCGHYTCILLRTLSAPIKFTPFVTSVDGLLHREAEHFLKRMATCVASKWKKSYAQTCGYIRARLSFAIIRAASLCLRGSRVKWRSGLGFEDGAALYSIMH